MRLTIQLCTYKRPALLARVLEACFEQTVSPDAYEVVLVNDGSPDETPAVIERLRPLARGRFTVIHQANAGLAKARNAGLARAIGSRIAFIDDDILPTPNFVEQHLRADAQHGDVIVRGAVINTASFDRLPPPVWSIANYSGNYFWTSNVSVRRERLERVGGRFDESFSEYGWEDIELGLRLRAIGTRAVFWREAVVYHHKPPPMVANVEAIVRQARAQARTGLQLERMHASWRVTLAIGDTLPQRELGAALVRSRIARPLGAFVARTSRGKPVAGWQRAALGLVRADAYYAELLRARAATPEN